MKRYRIGGMIVDCVRLTGNMADDDENLRPFDIGFDLSLPYLQANVLTALGWVKAEPGEWIVRNPRGELFVITPEDFDAHYVAVD
jgi:hypothetical protein